MLAPEEEYLLARRWREQGDASAAQRLVTSHLPSRRQETWLGFTRLVKWGVALIVTVLLLMAFFLL